MVMSEHNFGTPAAPDWRPQLQSNLAAFILQPIIKTIEVTIPDKPSPPHWVITIIAEPLVGLEQAVTLALEESEPPAGKEPHWYCLLPLPRDKATDPLQFDAGEVAQGTYQARLRVDNAESPPQKVGIL